jgi:hypothetical protein
MIDTMPATGPAKHLLSAAVLMLVACSSARPDSGEDGMQPGPQQSADASGVAPQGGGGTGTTADGGTPTTSPLCMPDPCAGMDNKRCDQGSGACVCDDRCSASDAPVCTDGQRTVCATDADGCLESRASSCASAICFDAMHCLARTRHAPWSPDSLEHNVSEIAMSPNGAIYVVGSRVELVAPTMSADVSYEAILARFDATGVFSWKQTLATADTALSVYGLGVAVDGDDAIYVAGTSDGEVDGQANAGEADIVLSKWLPDGTKEWTRQFGTENTDTFGAVAVSASGEVIVAFSSSSAFDGLPFPVRADVFFANWDEDGNKLASHTYSLGGVEHVFDLTFAADGALYAAGQTEQGNVDGNSASGGIDALLLKLGAQGELVWARQWGTASADRAGAVDIDAQGRIFVAGLTAGLLDDTFTKAEARIHVDDDPFVARVDDTGERLWTRQWTAAFAERLWLAAGGDGDVFASGNIELADMVGPDDAYVARFDAAGTRAWDLVWGDAMVDEVAGPIALAPDGRLVVLEQPDTDADTVAGRGLDAVIVTFIGPE